MREDFMHTFIYYILEETTPLQVRAETFCSDLINIEMMHVRVLGTGGTIASTDSNNGAAPSKAGTDIVATVTRLEDYATVDVEDVAQIPSYELDATTLEAIGNRVAKVDEAAGDAIIITHGTDTMEETAFYLDAAIQPTTPVFLTGAQRRFDETSPDGPANLLTAVRAARAFHNRPVDTGGVFIAFNEEIHAARTATKMHTSKLETFSSPSTGPVATVDPTGVQIHRQPKSECDHLPATKLDATVPVVKSGIGVSGDVARVMTETGADGLIVEGTGLGNVTADLGSVIKEVAEEIPVVVTSRCVAGQTAPIYGSVGGGNRLDEYGAVFAGSLPAHKARIKLQLALATFDSVDAVRDVFSD